MVVKSIVASRLFLSINKQGGLNVKYFSKFDGCQTVVITVGHVLSLDLHVNEIVLRSNLVIIDARANTSTHSV